MDLHLLMSALIWYWPHRKASSDSFRLLRQEIPFSWSLLMLRPLLRRLLVSFTNRTCESCGKNWKDNSEVRRHTGWL